MFKIKKIMPEEIQNNQDFNYQQIGTEPIQEGLRPIGQLLKDSFSIFKENFSKFLAIVLPIIVLNIFNGYIGEGLTLSVISSLLGIWITASLIYAISKKEIGVGESFSLGLRKFLPFLGLSIVVSVLTVLGFFLFVIPAIIFSVWFIFSSYILLLENEGIFKSIAKSREYVRGYGWQVFARMLVISLIAMVPTFITIGQFLLAWMSGNYLALIEQISIYGGGFIPVLLYLYSIFMMVISIIYYYLMYLDLKKIKREVQVQSTKKYKLGFVAGLLIVPAIIIFMIIAIVGGLRLPGKTIDQKPNYLISPPVTDRAKDVERVSKLVQLQEVITFYQIDNKKIPDDLDDLKQYLRGRSEAKIFLDDINQGIFYYKKLGDDKYELCVKQSTREDKCVNNEF